MSELVFREINWPAMDVYTITAEATLDSGETWAMCETVPLAQLADARYPDVLLEDHRRKIREAFDLTKQLKGLE